METLYQKIADTFNNNSQVFTDRSLPVPRVVDIYMGQPDDPENWEVFTPAIYLNWSIAPQSNNDPDLLTLDIHLVQEPGAATENFSDTMALGLEYLRMIKAVKYVVNKLQAANTTPLKWAGEKPADSPYFRYHIITYTCAIDGNSESLSRDTLTNVTLTDLDSRTGLLNRAIDNNAGSMQIDTF